MNAAIEKRFIFLKHQLQETSDGNNTARKIISEDESKTVPIAYSNFDIEKTVLMIRKMKIEEAVTEITTMLSRDEFIDGEISASERYIENAYANEDLDDFDCIKEALMKVYTDNYSDSHMVVGILMMISRIPYNVVEPKGTLMALGLLSHKDLEVRDRAIQCFERWNSKKGLAILKNIKCNPKWLQSYADKVIAYIEEEGIE